MYILKYVNIEYKSLPQYLQDLKTVSAYRLVANDNKKNWKRRLFGHKLVENNIQK